LGQWQVARTWSEYVQLRDIDMVSSSYGWAVGHERVGGDSRDNNAVLLKYDNGQWVTEPHAFYDMELYSVSMVDTNHGWAVGAELIPPFDYRTLILHFENGQWRWESAPDVGRVWGVSAIDHDEAWAVGEDGAMLHYTDGDWRKVGPWTSRDLYAIDMLHSTFGWAGGTQGALLDYNGSSWHYSSFGSSTVYGLDLMSATEGWLAADDYFWQWKGSGYGMYPIPPGLSVRAITGVRDVEAYAVGSKNYEGAVARFNGWSWVEESIPSVGILSGADALIGNDGLVHVWAVGRQVILEYAGAPHTVPTPTNTPRPTNTPTPTPTPTLTPTPTSTPTPEPVSALITEAGGTLISNDRYASTRVEFGAEAVTKDTVVTYAYERVSSVYPLVGIDHFFHLTAEQDGQPVVSFRRPVTIVIDYREDERGSAIPETLALHWLDNSGWSQEGLTQTAHTGTRLETVSDHFTLFGVLGETNLIYLPMVMR
jgi:hypothetical protein